MHNNARGVHAIYDLVWRRWIVECKYWIETSTILCTTDLLCRVLIIKIFKPIDVLLHSFFFYCTCMHLIWKRIKFLNEWNTFFSLSIELCSHHFNTTHDIHMPLLLCLFLWFMVFFRRNFFFFWICAGWNKAYNSVVAVHRNSMAHPIECNEWCNLQLPSVFIIQSSFIIIFLAEKFRKQIKIKHKKILLL